MRPADISLSIDAAGTEGEILTLRIDTPNGTLEVMGTIELAATRVVVSGCHMDGEGPNSWGAARLRDLGEALLEKLDVAEIVIVGAVRTTGANPGRRPNIVRITRRSGPSRTPEL